MDKFLEGDNGIVVGDDPSWRFTSGPVFGDFNCDGLVNQTELLLSLAGLAGTADTGGCLEFGAPVTTNGSESVWGDVDCDGDFDGHDALAMLLYGAVLWTPPENCPTPGTIANIVVNV